MIAAQLCKLRILLLANYKESRVSRPDTVYRGAVMEASLAEYGIESLPIVITSPPKGGAGFAGKSGRKTANACDTNAMEMKTNTAAHFMFAAISRIKRHGK
jgi:hypothetical protein